MQIKISNFKVLVSDSISLKEKIESRYKIKPNDIKKITIIKKSIDARNKNDVYFVYNLVIDIAGKYNYLLKNNNIEMFVEKNYVPHYIKWNKESRPIIVGFGPAGMFASLYLSRCGAKPIIIERGSNVENRVLDVNCFLKNKVLNPNSNVQFGEGGAGTFSDGKLVTNLNDPLIKFIFYEFFKHGAKEDILYSSMPHIGTDFLVKIVKSIREEIIENGGEFYFNTQFTSYKKEENYLVCYAKRDNKQLTFTTKHLLLGLGHSARDTVKMLYESGINIEPKSFSMGVRIEHLQKYINNLQYKNFAQYLDPASYKMAVHLKERSVYSFCMCPGGVVMASQSEENTIVTNGMSNQARDNDNANSALLVEVTPKDYLINSPLDGYLFQEKYERKAFEMSKDYKAPSNLLKEFIEGKVAKQIRSVKPSYPHGVFLSDLSECLPKFVYKSLVESIPLFDKQFHGFFCDDAILTAIESRSSSPVRILRDITRQTNVKGIYPIGEGAGYAGGITSSALDGLKTAIMIMEEE